MSVKHWNYYYKENKDALTKEWLVDTIRLVLSIGLLWLSFVQIIGEYFPSYVKFEKMILFFYILLLWFSESELLERLGERWRKIIPLIGVIFPFGYIVLNLDKMQDGLLEIANEYLYRFNPYQGLHMSLPTGYPQDLPVAMTAVIMILWMSVWGIAHFIKKPVFMVIFPVFAVLAVFLVGLTPDDFGIACIFVAAFLLILPKKTGVFRQAVSIGIVVLSIFAAGYFFDDEISELSTGKESIENWWEDFEFPVFSWDNFLKLDFVVNNERVTNYRPTYKGEVALVLRTGTRPATCQYLKGFCATDYENGLWKWDKSVFEQACSDTGYSEDEVARILSRSPFFVLGRGQTYDRLDSQLTVEYHAVTGDTLYIPYIFSHQSLNGQYSFSGDFVLKKNILSTQMQVRTGGLGDTFDLSAYTYYARYNDNYDIIRWYDRLAKDYTTRHDDIAAIDEAANYVRGKVSRPTEQSMWLNNQAYIYDELCIGTLLENMYRMELAAGVRSYLAQVMQYSLELDRIASGVDPVEYALTEGKEGYCMHYASAAVLILKELGVPARYASGYIVRPSDYELDSDSKQFEARVEDYNAHAWAEIYLDNIGWIPFEVTEGYSDWSQDLPTRKEPVEDSESESIETESTETEVETLPTETAPTETESSEEPIETETESPSGEPTEEQSSNPTENPSTELPGDGTQQGGDANIGDSKEIWENILKAAGVILLLFGIIYGCKLALVYYDYILKREIDNNRTRRAVKRMNRRIARIMRLTNFKSGQLTDERLEEVLKKTYPQVSEAEWTRYMEIVKKMHYSNEKISHEEMMHVYWCYKNV